MLRPQRAGLAAGPFGLHPTAPILARLPLLPADGDVDGLVGEGVFLASRRLGVAPEAADRSRQSVRAYELRARWRPTPHGVFAGVALAEVVDGPAGLCVGTGHRARTNPSAAWLAATCAMLLVDPAGDGLLGRLTLTAEATAVRRGQRWEVEAQPADGRDAVERRTVRVTPATDLIMALCADGAEGRTVLNAVGSRWPQAPGQAVLDALTDLIRHGFLLTNLLTLDASSNPIGQLLCALPTAHPMREPLVEPRVALTAADTHAPGHADRLQALGTARDLADRICQVERPLTVDVAVDARVAVPAGLVADAVQAAGVLCRIAPQRDPAADFHRRFVDRYGHHRHVPLLEAVDPVTGIGAQTPHEAGTEQDLDRLAVLNGLIAKACANRTIEVELDDAAITALGESDAIAPRSADVYVRLVADSDLKAAQGHLRVVVAGCVATAGSTLGRFASLLGHHHTEPEDGPVVIAELAVRPRSVSAQSAAPTTGFASHRIPVGVPGAGERDLRLADLLLVSDGTHLRVWSAALNRRVLPVLYSRLTPALLPPIARLLYLLGQAGTPPWHTWSWGAAVGPFHPRVRYQDVILSPARWTLPRALIAAVREDDGWEDALDQWRTDTVPAPPPTVLTEDDDRQLPLNLDHPDDRQLLRRYVRRGLTGVTEPPGGDDVIGAVAAGLHGRHLTELVIPLIRHRAPPVARHRAVLPARTRGEGLFHPGSPWLSLSIPTEPHLQDELVLRLAALARDLTSSWDSWFWLRYHTTALGPHLRVRFHGRPEILGGCVLPAMGVWAATMNDQRLTGRMVVECYEQEIERYGGTGAIEHAEQIFAIDSQLAVALLRNDPDDRIAAAAQVSATIARTVADGDPSALAGRHLDRADRQRMNRLRPGVRACVAGEQKPGGPELFDAMSERLGAYRRALPEHLHANCASSLIHMHANRTVLSADDEPLVRALAADLVART